MKFIFQKLFLIFSTLTVISEFGIATDSVDHKKTMNGYRISDYPNFQKWKLVTVRFRNDSQEMRFTYANPKAWKALQEKLHTFPDGAVFAKVGAVTEADPSFPSSAVPSGAIRVQLMVRSAKKHSETGGWGYAIFDREGNTLPGEPLQVSRSCFACHQVVAEKGFVFSEPMPVLFKNDRAWQKNNIDPKFFFEEKPLRVLSLKDQLAKEELFGFQNFQSLQGPMQKETNFAGALNEVRPLLMKQSLLKGQPAALISDDQLNYVVAIPNDDGGTCASKKLRSFKIISKQARLQTPAPSQIVCGP